MTNKNCFWILRGIIPALAIFLGLLFTQQSNFHKELEYPTTASKTPVRILSQDPLVIHINDFVSEEEAAYLVDLAYINPLPKYSCIVLRFDRDPLFKPSGTVNSQGIKKQSTNRTSSTAYLPNSDAVVQRIAARASEFQGFKSYKGTDLQLTRYYRGQQFKPHFDWFLERSETTMRHGNRMTTFFVILEASCTQCGTRFPKIHLDCAGKDARLNETIDCGDLEGLTVRAVPGSATFWRNLHFNGTGDNRTLHAGLPPEDGVKIGLNIWTSVKTDEFGLL